MSIIFWTLYTLCGLSDILDGFIARRTKSTSSLGEKLDSIADFLFILAVMAELLPVFPWKSWMLFWIAAIAAVRFVTFAIGFVKYRAVPWLHTISNKATGILLFLAPAIWQIGDGVWAVSILCAAASLSAIEELLITLRQPELRANVKSIFSL